MGDVVVVLVVVIHMVRRRLLVGIGDAKMSRSIADCMICIGQIFEDLRGGECFNAWILDLDVLKKKYLLMYVCIRL